jgi:hypothetical protein
MVSWVSGRFSPHPMDRAPGAERDGGNAHGWVRLCCVHCHRPAIFLLQGAQKPPVVGSEPYGLMVEIPPIYGKSVENRGWFMIVWPTWKTFLGFFEIDDEYQWMKSFSLHAIFRPTVFSGMFNLNKEWGHHLWRYINLGPGGHCGIAVLRLWRFRFPPIFMTAILGKRW